MFQQSRRGTIVWLFIVGLALSLTLAAGAIPTEIGVALLAAYLGLALLVARNVPLGDVMSTLPSRTSRQPQATEVAREAVARARSHPAYDALVQLLDVGLIVDEQRPDGLSLRRGRFISLDDEGIRPFAIVTVPGALADRLGRVRFELRDETGKAQYVYEDEKWLQAGENILLPDYRFPIRKNKQELEAGGWTLLVMVDGGMIGMHHFSLSPSLRERRRELTSTDGELRERIWRSREDDESLPLSLEELLRQQSRQRHQS